MKNVRRSLRRSMNKKIKRNRRSYWGGENSNPRYEGIKINTPKPN